MFCGYRRTYIYCSSSLQPVPVFSLGTTWPAHQPVGGCHWTELSGLFVYVVVVVVVVVVMFLGTASLYCS